MRTSISWCKQGSPLRGCGFALNSCIRSNRFLLCSAAYRSTSGTPRPISTRYSQTSLIGACLPAKQAECNIQEDNQFFHRTAEQQSLREYLLQQPCSILVIQGPRNSGKTALIKQLLAPDQASSSELTGEGSGAEHSTIFGSYLDGREQPLTQSADLASGLQAQGKSLLERFTDSQNTQMAQIYKARLTGLGVWEAKAALSKMEINLEPSVKSVFEQYGQEKKHFPLTRVIAGYTSMLEQFASLKRSNQTRMPWPVICIDEANVLTEWGEREEQQRDLRLLLRFFVRITKQERQAHIVLATSDYSFLDWLSKEIGQGFFQVKLIGDLPEYEARELFQSVVLPSFGISMETTDEQWAMVYQVAGGNPGLLINAAAEFKEDWKQSLASVWSPVLPKLLSALAIDSERGWSPSQFAVLAEKLLAAPHNAITVTEAEECLGTNSKKVLQSLVKSNLLAYRPFSAWAHDLPAAVHIAAGQKKIQPVVTAFSPADLYCMTLLQKDGDFERAKSPPGTKITAASTAGERLKLAMDALRDLDEDIKAVWVKIKNSQTGKPEFWRADLDALRKEKEGRAAAE